MWKQASPMDLLNTINEGLRHGENTRAAKDRRQQIKAQAYAQVCHMFNCSVRDLTPAQRALAENIENRMLGKTQDGVGYGFTIPGVADRRPNQR